MRKERNKGLAIILSLAMVIGMMPGWTSVVKAEGEPDYSFEGCTSDEDGMKVYSVNSDSEVKNFNNITIPANSIFDISGGEITANSVTIEAGGELVVSGASLTVGNINIQADGRLTILDFFREEAEPIQGILNASTITADPGATMFLSSYNNKPSCITGLYEVPNSSTTDVMWSEFRYMTKGSFTGWSKGDGSEYTVMIDGYSADTVDVFYAVSTDGTTFDTDTPVGVDDREIRIEGVPENIEDNPVNKVRVTIKVKDEVNKRIYYACHGKDVGSNELSDNYGVRTFSVEFDHTKNFGDEGYIPHEVHVALNNYRQGTQETADLISNYLYAYGDLNGDGSVNDEDMKIGLATELSSRFFWDEGGIIDGGPFDIYKPTDLYDSDHLEASRIEITNDGSIIAKDNSDVDQYIPHYTYRIYLGVTESGNDVSATGDVYALASRNDQILIWTGSEWFVRSKDDLTTFYEDTEDHSKDDKAVCVNTDFDPGTLKIAGNGCSEGAETISPEGDDVYCIQLMNYMYGERENPNDGSGRFIDYFEKYYTYSTLPSISCKLRLINADKTYVVVNSEGETKDVYGINSEQVDRIAQTGNSADKKSTDVFVGASAIHIEKVGSAISDLHITNVALKDDSMSDGVIITNPASDDFKVEFKSNFYDTVPLLITYDDGSVKELTINRVGLVISTQYLDDSGTYNFFHGGNRGSASCTYDYYHGQTIIVYATYYHPTNDPTGGSSDMKLYVTNADGTTKVINKAAYTAPSGGSVAMTDFIIDFRQGSEKIDVDQFGNWIYGANIDPSMQAMNAIVLNAGYDDATIFSGTQVGAGKGVYWDGHIEWNY